MLKKKKTARDDLRKGFEALDALLSLFAVTFVNYLKSPGNESLVLLVIWSHKMHKKCLSILSLVVNVKIIPLFVK
ncbi:MAG: hypothetical protein PG978_000727 [Wolbachia endosymbiont of Ctenocephalides felis wCfeF]|nr:MAG: hypothetical protein PG978_000727 [Wolbachia endosymbiont of Ctenocephalides felis wCfeF]